MDIDDFLIRVESEILPFYMSFLLNSVFMKLSLT